MIGDQVKVTYLARYPESRVQVAYGRLNVVARDDGTIAELVLEGDGSATFIPRGDVIKLESAGAIAAGRVGIARGGALLLHVSLDE